MATEAVDFRVGSAAGFEQAVVEHHRRLAGLAFVLTGDRRAAEDLVAEAYVRVWSRYRRHPVDDLGPYLRRSVVNLAYSRRRRWLVERRHAEAAAAPAGEPGFEDTAVARLTLDEALVTLPARQRAVVVLRLLEDLSEAETAAALRIRPGTVKSRLSRAIETLRHSVEAP